ncbi:hypothetical protein SAMN02910451_00906 [Butyrivibrio hungatei]|uniref:Uncharacterized protein n=1 Tax=Butyrivibrio hungatei TaxID=185008 RepID=A0A1G5C049_9FIRM|nr:hypothetical protein [Butyrivibrio hungatei]SCX95761.1 hypothetical protein SAMN02910451_00906 [Butyrivibrio hungatei]
MSTNIFDSLSGSYNYMSDMNNLLSDYSSIKNGSYRSLMKSYVKKVGNQAALNAYRETGSTANVSVSDPDKTTDSKKVTSTSNTKDTAKVTADKYEKFRSNWLDNQLKQYEKDGSKTTAADTSISIDTTT